MGPLRKLQDSSGHPAAAVDVVFHPSLVRRALNGSPQFSAEHFRGYLVGARLLPLCVRCSGGGNETNELSLALGTPREALEFPPAPIIRTA